MASETRTLSVLKETFPGETRVARSPEVAKKVAKVLIERGAGLSASFPDEEYAAAGAERVARGGGLH